MPRAQVSKEHGFTLLEMVLVMVIIGTLAGVFAPMLSRGMAASKAVSDNFQTLANVAMVQRRIARELRQIDFNGSAYQCDILLATQLRCVRNDNAATQINIYLSGKSLYLGYSTPSVSAVLLDNVNSLQFRYLDSMGAITADPATLAQIEFSLGVDSVSESDVLNLRTRVTLRDGA